MRCLVTGADGFLGANLCRHLLEHGHEVTGTALNRKGFTSLEALGVRVRLEYGDVTDAEYVRRVVNAYEAQWIFHLAGVSIVRIAEADPARAIRTNVLGTLNVLEAGRRAPGVQAVLVASSDKAYGDHGHATYYEDDPLTPTGAYEVSKACADHIARLYGARVLRCANLYGPGDLNWSRLVPNSCRRALQGQPPTVYASAWHGRREWLDVRSACRAYLAVAERGWDGEAFNAGSGEVVSAGALATMIAAAAGGPAPEMIGKAGFYEIPCQQLNSEKLRGLCWRPDSTVADGIAETVKWYREYLGGASCGS